MTKCILKRDLTWAKTGETVTLGAPVANGGQWIEHGVVHRADLVPVFHVSRLDPIAYLTDHRLDDYFEWVA